MPVTPSGVSTASARSSLIFRNAVRSQEIPDVFLEKAPAKASSQRPRRCYGALMASYRVPTEFLWRFYALSRRVHCAFSALTALSRRSHCAFTAFASCADGVASQKLCKYQEL